MTDSPDPTRRASLPDFPAGPGVYIFRNRAGEVVYVGKAKSLRKRLRTYFHPSRRQTADPKLRSLIHSIAAWEVFPVRNEAEALLLESRLIKQYAPRYNVDLRDDKRFLLIRIDPREPFPRLTLTRLRRDDGRLYFGPFPRAGILRAIVDFLNHRFGLRSCAVRRPDPETYRHCLQDVLKDCCRPCLGNVDAAGYRERLERVLAVLRGKDPEILRELREQMTAAAAAMRFEEAAKLRDMLQNLEALRGPGLRSFGRTTLASRMERSAGMARVEALRKALGLQKAPRRIECFDISNIGGRFAVGSMVCFLDGRPAGREYRRYRIRTVQGIDDFAMIREVIGRRYTRVMEEKAPLPDLVIVDGGEGQLNAAIQALMAANCPPLAIIGLAKREEEVHLPGVKEPLRLPRHDPALKLLQAVRDEAHRFAISYHRQLRRQRIADSILTEVPGIGRRRAQALLRTFGSVKRIRELTPEEMANAMPGLGVKTARRILAYLREHAGAPESG